MMLRLAAVALALGIAAAAPAPRDIEAAAAPAGGTVGFVAVHLPSGRTLALHAGEKFPMQSVFKLPIAIEVLRQVDGGALALDRVVVLGAEDARPGFWHTVAAPGRSTVGELLEHMVVDSDNTACDKLLALIGGTAAVDKRLRALGVDGIAIRFSEKEMAAGAGDNTATPAAMAALLGKIARREVGLSVASARRLEDLLVRVTTGPKRLKGALPAGTVVAHKTGTSQTRAGITDATNDVGLVTLPDGSQVAIAVFVHASPADEATREGTIARLARLAFDAFAPPASHK